MVKEKRPHDLLRNSVVAPSLENAIMNSKYVNAIPLYQLMQEFARNEVHLSRQNIPKGARCGKLDHSVCRTLPVFVL